MFVTLCAWPSLYRLHIYLPVFVFSFHDISLRIYPLFCLLFFLCYIFLFSFIMTLLPPPPPFTILFVFLSSNYFWLFRPYFFLLFFFPPLISFSYHFLSSPLGLYFYTVLTRSLFSVFLQLPFLALALIWNPHPRAPTSFHACGSSIPDRGADIVVNTEGGHADSREKPSVLRITV